MEYRYNGVTDEGRSGFPPPTSNYTTATHHAPSVWHTTGPSHLGHEFGHSHQYNHDSETVEAIWIELRKEKIREEMIAQEITRIRELMIERELAMERGANGQPAPGSGHDGRSLGARTTLSLEERIGISAMLRRFGRSDPTTF